MMSELEEKVLYWLLLIAIILVTSFMLVGIVWYFFVMERECKCITSICSYFQC